MANMTLDQTVREYLIENQYPEHRYIQALQFGISCLRELNLDVTGVPVSVDLSVVLQIRLIYLVITLIM